MSMSDIGTDPGTDPDTSHLSNLRFDELDLPETVQEGIRDAGFTHCTPIQALTLPPALKGEGVAGQAHTGTGKTAAYLITAYNTLLKNEPVKLTGREGEKAAPRCLIIAPTRELVAQIHHDAEVLGAHTGLKMVVIYGGIDYDKQRSTLAAGVDILVGTPGRLIDYFKQGIYTLKGIQVAILDEADRMFDLGFIKDIRYFFHRMPPYDERQSMLFSATLDPRVMELAYEHMDIREMLAVDTGRKTASKVKQNMYHVASDEKLALLLGILKDESPERTLVFVNTRREAGWLEQRLIRADFAARALTGDVEQRKRLRYLRQFIDGEVDILIATDVASRGLHIPNVSHVINFDLPDDKEDYVHRVGRTARAGAEGTAISFCCDRYCLNLPAIQEFLNFPIPTSLPPAELFADEELVRHALGGPKGYVEREKRPKGRPGDRGGRGGGRGSDRGGRGGRSGDRGRGRGPQRRSAEGGEPPRPAKTKDKNGANPTTTAAEGAPKRKRRRRRRRGGAKAVTTPTTTPDTPKGDA